MKYRFEIEQFTAKKKLPRDERYDITQYITTLTLEAEDPKKAYRRLADVINGRLSRDCSVEMGTITLPDYGNCQLVLRAVEDQA